MKKILAVMLTVVLFVPQLALCASAATDNPIVIENRISDELLAMGNRENSISKQTAEDQIAAALYSSISGDSTSLQYFLTNKSVTKKQFKMFNWSFIFSQFARPFQDSLQDVFNNEGNIFISNFFSESNISNVTKSVSSFLTSYNILGDDATDEEKMQAIGSFLIEDINVEEIKEYFSNSDNYTILNVYRDDNTGASLTDVLCGGFDIFQRLYIYDTVYDYSQVSASEEGLLYLDELNEVAMGVLNYGDYTSKHPNVEVPIVSKKIPIFVYDSATAFFLQLALSIYCTSNQTNIDALLGEYGDCPIVMDTFGNLCFYTNGQAKIVLPNFANPIFTNSVDEDNENASTTELYERIDMYNKWVTVAYSNTMRKTQSVFAHYTPEPLDDSISRYAKALPKQKSNSTDVRGNLLLVDPPTTIIDNNFKDTLKNILEKINNSETYYNLTNSVVLNTSTIAGSYTGNSANINGTIVSHASYINSHNISFYPALYSYNHLIASDDKNKYYENPFYNTHKTGQTNVSLTQFGGAANTSNNFTHAAIFGYTTHATSWSITIGDGTHAELCKAMNQHEGSQYNYLTAYNKSTVAIFNNESNQILKDARVVTCHAAISEDYLVDYPEMFIPSDIFDIGQYNSAYFSDERGMFIAAHKVYYDKDINSLATYLGDVLNYFKGNNGDGFFTDGANLLDVVSGGGQTAGATNDITLLEDGKMFFYVDHNNFSGFPLLLGPDFSKLTLNNDSDNVELSSIIYYALENIFNSASKTEGTFTWKLPKSILSDNRIDLKVEIKTINDQKAYSISLPTKLEYNSSSSVYSSIEQGKTFLTIKNGDILNGNGSSIFVKNQSGSGSAATLPDFVDNKDAKWVLSRQIISVLLTRYVVQQFCIAFNGDATVGTSTEVNFKNKSSDDALDKLKKDYEAFAVKLGFNDWHPEMSTTEEQDEQTNVAGKCLMTPDDFLWFVFNFERNNNNDEDKTDDGNNNIYFYDEYQYYLRQQNDLTGSITSTNATDFSSILYYWERYYIPKMTFNRDILSMVFSMYIPDIEYKFADANTDNFDKAVKAQLAKIFANYETNETNKYDSMLDGYLNWITKQESSNCIHKNILGYFWGDNKNNYNDLITMLSNPTTNLKDDVYDLLFKDSSIGLNFLSDEGKRQICYSILPDEAIVILPFCSSVNSSKSYHVNTYTLNLSMPTAEAITSSAATRLAYEPAQTIMALISNTDAVHNNLTVMPPVVQTTHVSKEDLMDEAHQFFSNPVSCLEYILSGFMYKLHQAIATGDVGSVFNANWLLDSGIYKWITDRYLGFVTVIIVILLFIKLTQLAMSKTRNYAVIPRDIAGILAMVMVPVLVFNSFIWVFNATSDWALAGPANKMLLSSINKSLLDKINADISVNSELGAFKEQFSQIQGEYDGICVEEMTAYGFSNPVYRTVSISSYSSNVSPNFSDSGGAASNSWYTSKGFVPVQKDRYQQSMFYYFYDYIKAEFYQYCISQGATKMSNTKWIDTLDTVVVDLQNNGSSNSKDLLTRLQGVDAALSVSTGNFVKMLNNLEFVYGNSLKDDRYNGAYVKDLAGVYNLFDEDSSLKTTFSKAPWYMAMQDADIIIAEDDTVPKRWTDQDVLAEYYDAQNHDKGRVHGTTTNNSGQTVYEVFTSKLDFFVPSLNDGANQLDARVTDFALTPLEEKLCSVTEDIYSSTVKALEYHTDQIKDEAAIQLMAWIATFKVSEAFGIAPAEPVQETITLDTVIRTAFIRDLDSVSGGDNALYAMITQGDSIFRVMLVVILELAISIASILRIILILYLTVGSFVVLGLRLLHKAPATTDLIYGIVGNILMLLFLHALTLFLVVCAVQWVAVITDTIPELLLDVAVILFIILLAVILGYIVRNLIKDAINLGGAKIKAGVKSIAGAIANFITKGTKINALATELSSNQVTVNATNISQEIRMQQQHEEQLEDRRERAERMLDTMNRVEDNRSDVAQREQEDRSPTTEGNTHDRPIAVNRVDRAESAIDQSDDSSNK